MKIKKISYYLKLAGAEEIIRRYFVINTFDGVLTTLGILLGSALVGMPSHETIFVVFSAMTAMAVSGVGGVILSEKAEREREIKELETVMLRRLKRSVIEKSSKTAIVISALVDGITPFLASVILLLPYLFLKDPFMSFKISFGLAILFLGVIGGYLGKMSKKNIFLGALEMITAGLIAIVFIILFKHF